MKDKTYSYILGAGASSTDGIPITHEIVETAFFNFGGKREGSDIHLLGTWDKDKEVATIKPVFQIIDRFYGTRLSNELENLYKTGYHTAGLSLSTDIVESFFSKLYRIINGLESCDFLSTAEASQIYKAAGFLFFNTICCEMLGIQSPKAYLSFVEKVLRRQGLHRIISFNYDLLLEASLINRRYLTYDGRQWSYPPDLSWTYGIDVANFSGVPYEFPPISNAKILLLKLHGSLNLGYCPTTREASLHCLHADAWIYGRFHDERILCPCGDNSHRNLPLLIPPIENKEIAVPSLKKQWELAKQGLAESDEVHIIGYSLPSTDKEAAILIEGIKKVRLQRLVIVNPSAEHCLRFRRSLESTAQEVVIYKTFEEYLAAH